MSPFKNLRLYHMAQPWPITSGDLAEALAGAPARSPGALEREAHGWQPPAGRGEPLVVSVGGRAVVCLRTTERVLPAAVVAEELERRVAEIEREEGRTLGRKELRDLRAWVYTTLLAEARTQSRKTYAWIDPARGWLAVGAGSASGAELLLGQLRETVGALAVRPMAVLRDPSEVLTEWLHTGAIYPFGIAEACTLVDPEAAGSAVRCQHIDLSIDEVQALLTAGYRVERLALEWDDRVACTLDTALTLRAIEFLEEVHEQRADVQAETEAERFAADAEIAIGTLTEMVEALVVALGGHAP
jgi:recombination associated protein RdgC